MDALQGSVSRRKFLKYTAIGAAAVPALSATFPVSTAETSARELATEHSSDPALLIDLTKCIGCGRCAEACKTKNHLATLSDQPFKGDGAVLSESNYTVVQSYPGSRPGRESTTVKRQCLHCLEPACASVCFPKALHKTPEGPIVYNQNKCIGCRFCLMACPFGVPVFEFDKTIGKVDKCDLCYDRTSKGLPTACAGACPTGAITFGKRGELLTEAGRRIKAQPDLYVGHVYGETEAGGTSVMYISDVAFEEIGFVEGLPGRALPEYTWEITRLIPPLAIGAGAGLIALYWRRKKLMLDEQEAREGEGVPR
jgi:formate dehydrogenase iron-sulfur subunit